ncbi:hypothetical protein AFK69_14570 [Xenorhabdus sp. GDc328]|nr:hypothetical protein AAY47_04830 [Xenorhabdus griffiniae]KOP32677.1 hypothetical protein AFK69_14570 [Xenorhabdus sp. GDc328]
MDSYLLDASINGSDGSRFSLTSTYIRRYVLSFSIFSTILLYSFQTTDIGELKQQIEIEPPVAG